MRRSSPVDDRKYDFRYFKTEKVRSAVAVGTANVANSDSSDVCLNRVRSGSKNESDKIKTSNKIRSLICLVSHSKSKRNDLIVLDRYTG